MGIVFSSLKITKKRAGIGLLFFCLFLCSFPCDAIDREQYANKLANRAIRYSKTEDKKQLAVQLINKAISLQPGNLELYYKRGFILGRAGRYDLAIKTFNKLVPKKQFPHAVRFRGDCFMALGYYKRAAADYSKFLKKYPKDGKVWSYLVEALALMGDRSSAMAAAQKGIMAGSHWTKRLEVLYGQLASGQGIEPHQPLSN